MKFTFSLMLLFICSTGFGQSTILINNVQIFNGKDEKTITGNVLIVDNIITRISLSPIPTNRSALTKIIDGKGRFLMPGLIDAHWHAFMTSSTMADLMTADIGYTHLKAGLEAGNTLLRGFTTIRDLGGPVFGLKRAIDEGSIPGPRIYPSGSTISQTSGHGDFKNIHEKPVQMGGSINFTEEAGAASIADGKEAVLAAVRFNLKQGATQIKMMAGGGVSSVYDPLDVSQFTLEELSAAVEAAEDWGTYVTVHAYTPRAIQKAIKAGVKCIDHGHLLDEETVKLMAEKGVWLSMQPFDSTTAAHTSVEQKQKKYDVANGTANIYKLAKKYKLKIAWGTDLLFDPSANKRQNATLTMMTKWFSPFEILKMITYDNAQLLKLSDKRNPYKAGELGIIAEGAYADLILVDGNPMNNIQLLTDPEKNIPMIIKNGQIYKNNIQ
jgi:imidazolonepropionase-like amidohydrolase